MRHCEIAIEHHGEASLWSCAGPMGSLVFAKFRCFTSSFSSGFPVAAHLLPCPHMFDITLSLPDEALVALKRTPSEMADEIRLAAAMKLYELGRLSSGAAARRSFRCRGCRWVHRPAQSRGA